MDRRIYIDDTEQSLKLLGQNDKNLRFLSQHFPQTKIIPRGNEIILRGSKEETDRIFDIISNLLEIVKNGAAINEKDMKCALSLSDFGAVSEIKDISKDEIATQKKIIRPKTIGQQDYVRVIAENDVVFAIGPAGTGKTYLAMAMAVKFLSERSVNRIVLVRPVVEAGERLGYLPGDMYAKVDPYFRPLYDALYQMMDMEKLSGLIEKGVIEIAPLAYMRGRTLDNSFIILDEAQNTTVEQMKMFLTRLGYGSRAVITGDVTQIDLDREENSGLVHIQSILDNIKGIAFAHLTGSDVVRHELVKNIIKAYEEYEKNNKKRFND